MERSSYGESVSLSFDWRGSKSSPEAGGLPAFPPSVIVEVEVKALACELPSRLGLPLSRFSVSDIRTEVLAQGIVAQISGSTLWRWPSSDAIRPWRHRSWIFPRDPEFVKKAAPVLEHEYQRGRALNYLAAWDVHRARIIGRCEPKTGIALFDRLVEQVMSQQPYRSADRVLWVVDNCSSHRGQKASERLRANCQTQS